MDFLMGNTTDDDGDGDGDGRDAPDHDAEIDALFKKMEAERGNEINLLLNMRTNAGPRGQSQTLAEAGAAPTSEPPLRAADALHLFESLTLKRWDKVRATHRPVCMEDPSVGVTNLLVDALMASPLAKRPVSTPQFVLVQHDSEGCFRDMLAMDVFGVGTDRYLLCTTLIKYIDPENILTGCYVFMLIDAPRWTHSNVETRAPSEPGIINMAPEKFQVMKERARLANFFFECLPWKLTTPLPKMTFK